MIRELVIGGRTVLLEQPAAPRWLYMFAHGAGAGMRHAFMTTLSAALAERSVATLRWEFPYMAAGKPRPDRAEVAEAAVRSLWTALDELDLPALPRFAGGKSFGGRMTSRADAWTLGGLRGLAGLAFVGFPLYGAGAAPSTARADHLAQTRCPLLFVQGSRDELADLATLRPVIASLAPRAELHVVEHADHGFGVRVSSGRRDADVYAEIATTIAAWMERVAG